MKSKRVVPIVVFVVVVVAVGIYFAVTPAARSWLMLQLGLSRSTDPNPQSDILASGFIEAEEVAVAPELGGRVTVLLADEGDEVEAGQVLVQLDETLLEAQIEVAQAGLEVAQATLARAQAGARPEQIRQAEAGVARAEAARDGAYRAWQDLIAIRDNPQELDAQIVLAKAQVATAEAALTQATALKDAAEIAHDAYEDGLKAIAEARQEIEKIPEPYRPSLPQMPWQAQFIPNAYWKAWVGVNAAQVGLDGARAALNDLYAMRDNPQELNAQIDAAEAKYRAAEAAVEMARAQLDALRAGATAEEIAVVEAQVEQAQAAVDALIVLRGKQVIVAPVGGLVLERSVHQGELAAPGATLLTLGDLDQVTLTVYVPEDKLGWVSIGQQVEVRVDSFLERVFMGTVVAIADEAEFTPRNVQTQEERVNMVFAVEVRIPNPDHALKPGLPADATFVVGE